MILQEFFVKLGLNVDAASFAKGQLAVNGISFALSKLGQYAAAGIESAFDALIGFNARAETIKMSLAGIMGMNLKLPWVEAKNAADSLFKDLQEQAATTPATTSELVNFARDISSAYFQAGKSVKDLAKFTADSVVAAKMLNLEGIAPLDVTQALQGRVTQRDRFARAMIEGELKMKIEDFNKKSITQRADLWTQAINSPTMQAARAEYDRTWTGATSNIKDRLGIMFGEMGQTMFQDLKKGAILVAKYLKEHKKDIKEFFMPFLTAIRHMAYFVVAAYRSFALLYNVLEKYPPLIIPLIGLFMTLGGISVGTALAAAAAWLLPVAAIVALVLILEDLYVFFQGGDSLIGDMFKGGEMPGWMRAIKDTIDGFMHLGDVWEGFKIAAADALAWLAQKIDDFFGWMGRKAKEAGEAIIDAINPFSGNSMFSPVTMDAIKSLATPPTASSVGAAMQNFTMRMGDITVNAPTGDGKEIAGALKRLLDEHIEVMMRSASVGVLR